MSKKSALASLKVTMERTPLPTKTQAQVNLLGLIESFLSNHVVPYGTTFEWDDVTEKFQITVKFDCYVPALKRLGNSQIDLEFDPSDFDANVIKLKGELAKIAEYHAAEKTKFNEMYSRDKEGGTL